MIDLGLPRRPTDSIQCEGRTYRDGLKSNTIWEYLIINTIFERSTFAQQISERASTAKKTNGAILTKLRLIKPNKKSSSVHLLKKKKSIS